MKLKCLNLLKTLFFVVLLTLNFITASADNLDEKQYQNELFGSSDNSDVKVNMFISKNKFACKNLNKYFVLVGSCSVKGYESGFHKNLQDSLAVIFSEFLSADDNAKLNKAKQEAKTKFLSYLSNPKQPFLVKLIDDLLEVIDKTTAKFRNAYNQGKGSFDEATNEKFNFALVGGDSEINPYLKVRYNNLFPIFADGFSVAETFALIKYYDETFSSIEKSYIQEIPKNVLATLRNFYNNKDDNELNNFSYLALINFGNIYKTVTYATSFGQGRIGIFHKTF